MSQDRKPLRVVALDGSLPVLGYAHEGDAGLDLRAREGADLAPAGGRATIGTGVAIELPVGHVGLVCPRSGLASMHGVTVLNAPGIVDEGYRGEIAVVLINLDPEHSFVVSPGDRIAQLVVAPITGVEVTQVDVLSESERGEKGFGHTGR